MVRFTGALGLAWIVAVTVSGCVIVIGEDDATDAHWVVDYEHRAPQRGIDSYPQSDGSPADRALLDDVRARLSADAALREAPILVAASAGVVTLRGEITSAATLDRAVRIVSEAPGVETVVMKVVLATQH